MATAVTSNMGYLILFSMSFLAATLLPGNSEVLVAIMPSRGYNVWLVLLVATAGNYLGALINYCIGKYGRDFFFTRFMNVESEKLQRAENIFKRWGVPVLFFSWIPIIGDPLTVVGGVLNVNIYRFTVWVVLGKALRYLIVAGIANKLINY